MHLMTMKGFRPRAAAAMVAMLMGFMGTASVALAAFPNGNWVLDGSTVSYSINATGTGLFISEGDVVIGNVGLAVPATLVNVGLPGQVPMLINWAYAKCNNNNSSTLAANTAYYVYAGSVGGLAQFFVSTVNPIEDGTPSVPITSVVPGVGCGVLPLVYLGSFITETNATIIVPFERVGEQELFLNAGIAPTQAFSMTKLAPIDNANLTWAWPLTASSLILHASVANNDGSPHDVEVVDPNFSSGAACPGGPYTNLTENITLPNGAAATSQFNWGTPLGGGVGMTLAACESLWGAGAKTVTATVFYRGYTEVIHHLDRVR